MNSIADILSEKTDENLPVNELKTMLYAMKGQVDVMLRMLDGERISMPQSPSTKVFPGDRERVVEGAFTGEKMLGGDGKEYPVPPNYASKSKIVHGDRMKLTITKSGSFIFKQTGPVERKRVMGELAPDPSGTGWVVMAEGRPYRVLTASVTFYRGKGGDETILLLPQGNESQWGAVDNIISK